MKKLKKFFSLLLVALMVMALGTAALAADPAAKLTITNATEGQTYTAYKIFDLTYGANDAVNYTYTKTGDDDKLFDVLKNGKDTPFTLELTSQGNYTVTTDETDGAVIGEWLRKNVINIDKPLVTAANSAKAEADGSLDITLEDYGYYYVDTTLGTIVTVNSAKPTANITEKNEVPTLDKDIVETNDKNEKVDVKANDAAIGDTVSYKITIEAKAGAVGYVVTDTLSSGLTLSTDEDDYTVKNGSDVLTENEDYTIAFGDDNSFTVTFDDDYLADELDEIDASAILTIEYSAVINEDAVIGGEAGNPNTAYLEYGRKTGDDKDKTPDSTVSTYVFAFDIVKTNGTDKLSGAEFSIYTDKECTKIVKFNQEKDKDNKDLQSYKYDKDGTVEVITTDSTGTFNVNGLAEGIYYVKEVNPPSGYNGLTDPVKVEIVATETKDANDNTYLVGKIYKDVENVTAESDDVENITIINQAGSVLPSTGGIGTTLFYIFGGIMLVGAAVVLITRRRVNE